MGKFDLSTPEEFRSVLVLGGGQAALALGYFLKRTSLDFLILDDQPEAGGAWNHGWKSLQLFSPADFSSLPGWQIPRGMSLYPTRDEVVSYLTEYERRYELPIRRPVRVRSVQKNESSFIVETDQGRIGAKVILSATGTWSYPHIPEFSGHEEFRGEQLHATQYREPGTFQGKSVLVVGGGNSGAQILAEVSEVAKQVLWVTREEPTFLPDEVDGRFLFAHATERYQAQLAGRDPDEGQVNLGDIVMVEPVRRARERGVLKSVRPFVRFKEKGVVWADGSESQVDAVIWCTGFRPALDHLSKLKVIEKDGRVRVSGTRSVKEPGLWLVGYGDWTGFGSATLIGVQRYARKTVQEVVEYLGAS